MLLKKFLKKNGIKIIDLAKAIGCTPQHISNYVRGRGKLSFHLAKLIEYNLQGKILAEDLLRENPTFHKAKLDKLLKDLV